MNKVEQKGLNKFSRETKRFLLTIFGLTVTISLLLSACGPASAPQVATAEAATPQVIPVENLDSKELKRMIDDLVLSSDSVEDGKMVDATFKDGSVGFGKNGEMLQIILHAVAIPMEMNKLGKLEGLKKNYPKTFHFRIMSHAESCSIVVKVLVDEKGNVSTALSGDYAPSPGCATPETAPGIQGN